MMGSKNAALWVARQQAGLAEREADDIRAEIARLREADDIRAEIARLREAEPIAWLSYWPGAGGVDSTTRTTHLRGVAERWRADGFEVTPLWSVAHPSTVTEAMAEPVAFIVHDTDPENGDYLTRSKDAAGRSGFPVTPLFSHPPGVTEAMVERAWLSIWNNPGAPFRFRDMRAALEAALLPEDTKP